MYYTEEEEWNYCHQPVSRDYKTNTKTSSASLLFLPPLPPSSVVVVVVDVGRVHHNGRHPAHVEKHSKHQTQDVPSPSTTRVEMSHLTVAGTPRGINLHRRYSHMTWTCSSNHTHI